MMIKAFIKRHFSSVMLDEDEDDDDEEDEDEDDGLDGDDEL